jgi:hypothetical protein
MIVKKNKTKKVSKKPIKKITKKVVKKEKLIGDITHYFRKIKVAVIKTKDILKVGDSIRVIGGEVDFVQKIESMEIEGEKLKKVLKGKQVGLKLKKKAREGYRIYKVNV